MQAASINNAGQIAFFADYHPTPDTINSGWFGGAPGNWRKVVVFFDPIDGGQCLGLAYSRNPMQTIDAAGNVVFWANLDSNGTADRLVLGLTDGNLLIAARRGDPTRQPGASPIRINFADRSYYRFSQRKKKSYRRKGSRNANGKYQPFRCRPSSSSNSIWIC
jgi:hypothetical protein